MTNLAEAKEKETISLCIFGRAKIGKTALAGQIARIGKLWWFDLENGVKTLTRPDMLPIEFHKNINVFRIPSRQDIPMGIETILKVILGSECYICWDHGKVSCPACSVQGSFGKVAKESKIINRICLQEFTHDDWLVIDSVTQLSNDTQAAVYKSMLGTAVNPEDFLLDKDTGLKDFKYPRAVSFMLDKIFSTIQSGNFNSISVSHETMIERMVDTGKKVGANAAQPGDSVEIIVPTAGSRNFSRNFGRYFDSLINCDLVNGKFVARSMVSTSSAAQVGSRIGNIEDMKDAKGAVLPAGQALVKLISDRRKPNG